MRRAHLALLLALACLFTAFGGLAADHARAAGLPTFVEQRGGASATFPDGTPLPTELPLTGQSESVSSVAVANLHAGENLAVSAEAEVTDDVIVALGSSRIWLDMPVTAELVIATTPEATTGLVLAAPAGGTLTWREHHTGLVRDASLTVPASLDGQSLYVNLVLASHPATAPTSCYDLNRSTGIFSPAAACVLHVENDDRLVDLGVMRTPATGAGVTTEVVPGTATDATLPVPASSADPAYIQPHVAWASAPISSIRTGDVLQASADVQASIERLVAGLSAPGPLTTGCNVMLSGRFYLSPYPDRLPAAGDPLGSAVPDLGDGYAVNLTQTMPRAIVGFHGTWVADGNYTSAQVPARYVVLVVWTSGSSACQAPAAAGGGIQLIGSGTSGSVVDLLGSPSAAALAGGASTAEANGAATLAGASTPRVLSVVPVRMRAGDLLTASADAAIDAAASAQTGLQLVLGTSDTSSADVSGTPLTASATAISLPGTDRTLTPLWGSHVASGAEATGSLAYVKLIGYTSSTGPVGVDPQTSLIVHLLRSGAALTATDLPSPAGTTVTTTMATPTTPPPAPVATVTTTVASTATTAATTTTTAVSTAVAPAPITQRKVTTAHAASFPTTANKSTVRRARKAHRRRTRHHRRHARASGRHRRR